MDDILISVIIPYFNSVELLKRLLESFLYRKNVELIVVDDHSTANKDRLENMKETYPAVIWSETPEGKKGPGAARNKGLDLAKGEWIVFADADDVFLSSAWEIIEDELDDKSDVIIFPYTYDGKNDPDPDQSQNVKMIRDYVDDPSRKNEIKLKTCVYPVWSKVYRRSFLQDKIIRFEEVSQSEDVLFSAQTGLLAERFKVAKRPFYSVYRHTDSLSHADKSEDKAMRDRMYVRYYKFVRNNLGKETSLLGWTWKTEILVLRRALRVFFYDLRKRKSRVR